MKKIFVLFSSAVLLMAFVGCTKQGPAGPAGPAGPSGPSGGSGTVVIDTFSIASNAWVQTQTGYFKYVHTDANFTQKVVDVGAVEVSIKNSAYPDWFGMPDVVAGGAGFRFSYGVGSITIFADNMGGTVSAGLRNYYKVVIRY